MANQTRIRSLSTPEMNEIEIAGIDLSQETLACAYLNEDVMVQITPKEIRLSSMDQGFLTKESMAISQADIDDSFQFVCVLKAPTTTTVNAPQIQLDIYHNRAKHLSRVDYSADSIQFSSVLQLVKRIHCQDTISCIRLVAINNVNGVLYGTYKGTLEFVQVSSDKFDECGKPNCSAVLPVPHLTNLHTWPQEHAELSTQSVSLLQFEPDKDASAIQVLNSNRSESKSFRSGFL
ncbi:hypothetical protein RFI_18423, partial [Reticulomyxa filosa]